MKTLSIQAELSNVYTNHCLRAACITALDQSGFEARHIMSVSGQKSEASIRSYSRNVSDTVRHEMSLALTHHMTGAPGTDTVESNQQMKITVSSSQEKTTVHPPHEDIFASDLNMDDILCHLDSVDTVAKQIPTIAEKHMYNFSNCNVTFHNS